MESIHPRTSTQSNHSNQSNQATDEKQTRENWALIIRICDNANSSVEKARETVAAVAKRVAHANANVALFALTLANALVQNCAKHVRRELSSRVFVDTLVRVVAAKGVHMTVRMRVLEMMQDWAKKWEGDSELGYLVDAYKQMKSQGYNFPDPNAKPESARKTAAQLAEEQEKEEMELALALSMSAQEHKSTSNNRASQPPPVATPTMGRNPICRVRALYDFPGLEEGELRLYFNDIINVHDDTTFKEWWKGECDGRVGIFPSNYVEKIANSAPDTVAPSDGAATATGELKDEENVERFVVLLANMRPGESLSENARVQELYHTILMLRPKLLSELETSRTKQDELVQLNERFTAACTTYHRLMDASLAAQRSAYQQHAPPLQQQRYYGTPAVAGGYGFEAPQPQQPAYDPYVQQQQPDGYSVPPQQQGYAPPVQQQGYYQQ
ncbi:hypothetical protein BC830DRAFT_1261070 [Chytriomyces sp. MP71]|nr:hypothetical protein BC830DRAFT_1261070 [Chytriomyces sp. MP71]